MRMSRLQVAFVFLFTTLLAACGGGTAAHPEYDETGGDVADAFEETSLPLDTGEVDTGLADEETSADAAEEIDSDTGSDDALSDASEDALADSSEDALADSSDDAAETDTAPTTVPTIAIDDVTVTEGNTGVVEATFTATLSSATSKTVTVSYATSDDTALAGSDYVAAAGTISFAPGTTTQIVKVTINPDALDEANETFRVKLSSPVDATLADDEGIGTIADDDAAPTLSVDDVTIDEGSVGTATAVLTVTLSAPSGLTVTASFGTADGTATTADYVATSGTLTFAPGTTTQKINVSVSGDTIDENDETFTVALSSSTNATLAKPAGTVTITDDDDAPEFSVADLSFVEGNAGTRTASLTVSLSAISGKTTSVQYQTANGTAIAGSDYVATTGTLTFAPGETAKLAVVTVNGDTTNEADETFEVNLSGATNASIAKATGIGTILNDDSGLPTLTIGDATVAEGDSGTKTMTFTVTASAPPTGGGSYTVAYATAHGTATDADYVPTSGTLTFGAGELTKTIVVTINGDTSYEADEHFSVNLSSPTGASIADGNGVGVIVNDDTRPTVSIANASTAEGASGVRALTFTVSLSTAAGVNVSVNYATADGTATTGGSAATGGSDYVAATGTINFAPGVATQTVSVVINGDTLNEADETLTVALSSPTNATIGTGTATGTITNDDALPSLGIADSSGAEGNTGTTTRSFTVTLSGPSGRTITVNYATENGTASSGSDYVATSGTLTFAPGQTVQALSVPVNGDTVAEPNETFTVLLSTPVNATIADGSGTGTIFNDDGSVPILNINDATVDEGNAGTKSATFTVTLSTASTGTVTVDFATSNDTATAGADYTSTTGALTFAPGETSKTITVLVHGDTLDENNETFFVTLANAMGASVADAQGAGTINDDDASPTLSIADSSIIEATATVTLTVTLSTASGRAVTVNYATSDGTATAGGDATIGRDDYASTSGTLIFAPGETSKTVSIPVKGDALDELDETVNVALSGATNASIADGNGVLTIKDDDATPTLSIADLSATEGHLGGKTFNVIVTLSAASARTITVGYATANGTATSSGLGADYAATSGTLTFNPGEKTKLIPVTVYGNLFDEGNETFFVNLSSPSNATIADGSATVTIVNDD